MPAPDAATRRSAGWTRGWQRNERKSDARPPRLTQPPWTGLSHCPWSTLAQRAEVGSQGVGKLVREWVAPLCVKGPEFGDRRDPLNGLRPL